MNVFLRETRLYEEMASVLKTEGMSDERVALVLSEANSNIRKADETMLTVSEVESLITNCRSCYKKDLVTENGPVIGRGRYNEDGTVDILFIGLMPGKTEEETGRIFTGPNSGVLLEHMAKLGIGADECPVYAQNLVCCMPLSKTPKVEQIRNCSPFLAELMYILEPNIVVPLGAKALSFLLGKDVKLEDYEGEVLMQGRYIVVPVKHPSALHRIPDDALRKEAFSDYYTKLAGIKRMNDRIKKLRASGELKERGSISMFNDTESEDDKDQFTL